MAFSFTPGQIAPQGSQIAAAPGTVAAGVAPVVGPPSDSPFLFIRERGQPFSVMAGVQIVLTVVAVLSIVIGVTIYSYSVYLTTQIETKRKDIDTQDVKFPVYPYEDMLRLSLRMSTLDRLFKSYISPRSPLKFLENVVENQVAFNSFGLSKDMGGAYKVTFMVETTNYKALIQQLAALNLTEYHKVIPNPKSSGIIESGTLIKISVTTPVLVQGKLPDDIVFMADPAVSSDVGSSTPGTPSSNLQSTGSPTP